MAAKGILILRHLIFAPESMNMVVAHGSYIMVQYFSPTSPTNTFIDRGWMKQRPHNLPMMTDYGSRMVASMKSGTESSVSSKIIEATAKR